MEDAFIGEIRPFAFSWNPMYFLPCDGRLVSIMSYQALYSLVGTTFGGDGKTTFGLPNLAGTVVNSQGQLTYPNNTSGLNYLWSKTGGVENVTLNSATMPPHTHQMSGILSTSQVSHALNVATNQSLLTNIIELTSPTVGRVGQIGAPYASGNTAQLNPGVISPYTGGNGAHSNMQPFLVINYAVCYDGIYPQYD